MTPASTLSELLHQVAQWSTLWGVPGLENRLTLAFSARLRTALGRAVPNRQSVRLNAALLHGPQPLMLEVLCHEVAHLAVFELHGRVRPHGAEWQALVHAAGFTPRIRAAVGDIESVIPSLRARQLYDHRCPVCQARRIARRRVTQWRCAACIDAGLDGHLVIVALSPPEPRGR